MESGGAGCEFAGTSTALPTVSVIVPFRTHGERLGACLRALAEQSYPADRYSVVVVANGHRVEAERFADLPTKFYVEHEAKPGAYAARNRGVECAAGDVLAFTDADCVPAADWLEKGVRRLIGTPNCGLVGGRIDLFFADPNRPSAVEVYESFVSFRQQDYVERWHFAATANVFTHRHVFKAVGCFNDRLPSLGDREWGARVFRAGYRLVYADDATVRHPARRSFAELHERTARVAGGFFELLRSARRPAFDVYRDLCLGLAPTRLVRHRAASPAAARRARLRALCVFGFVVAVRGFELLRLSFGGRPRWS